MDKQKLAARRRELFEAKRELEARILNIDNKIEYINSILYKKSTLDQWMKVKIVGGVSIV